MKNNSINEVNALDFIGEPIKAADILKAEEMLKMNYGIDYPTEKFSMLWEMIKEQGWTDYRLKETLKWFLRNKRYPNWTIADWFDYSVKLFSYAEYLDKLNINKGLNEQIEWYNLHGIYCWRYKDGTEIPLPKAEFKPIDKQFETANNEKDLVGGEVLLSTYSKFYQENMDLFTENEQKRIMKSLENKQFLSAGFIIEPKKQELEMTCKKMR
ncbi:MAG: hypothetical protein AB1432_05615 [Bacteroidota bacterium]